MENLSFWIVAGSLSFGAAGLMLFNARANAKIAPADIEDGAKKELQVYREQLREVERDLAKGTLPQAEADRLRAEIGRRLLDADKATAKPAKRKSGSLIVPSVALAAALAGTFALYNHLGAPRYPDMPLAQRLADSDQRMSERPKQAEAVANLPAASAAEITDPDFAELMDKLRLAVDPATSTDQRGLELLSRIEAALGDSPKAEAAQSRLIAVKDAAATAEDYAALADILVRAAQGYVSPEAETALKEALRRDPQNGMARYYSGLMFAQGGRFDRAFALWRPLVEAEAADAPWVPYLREELPRVAQLAGVKYELPALRGPSAADIAASSDLSAEDRQAMIEGMVNQLSERLATKGGSAAEWAQLIGALGVLGRMEEAEKIYNESMVIFDVQPEAKAQIDAAARQSGVIQ